MKIITEKTTNISKYVFNDSDELTFQTNMITTPTYIIGDMGTANSTLYESVTNVPEDWTGGKYLFNGTTWSANPNWTEPDGEED